VYSRSCSSSQASTSSRRGITQDRSYSATCIRSPSACCSRCTLCAPLTDCSVTKVSGAQNR
jgi:hypothetical protein